MKIITNTFHLFDIRYHPATATLQHEGGLIYTMSLWCVSYRVLGMQVQTPELVMMNETRR